jgi:hypothetical protein
MIAYPFNHVQRIKSSIKLVECHNIDNSIENLKVDPEYKCEVVIINHSKSREYKIHSGSEKFTILEIVSSGCSRKLANSKVTKFKFTEDGPDGPEYTQQHQLCVGSSSGIQTYKICLICKDDIKEHLDSLYHLCSHDSFHFKGVPVISLEELAVLQVK